MENNTSFTLNSEDSLILVNCKIDDRTVRLIVDTGASHTHIHNDILLMLGYTSDDIKGTVSTSTINGVLQHKVYQIDKLELLNQRKTNMLVSASIFDRQEYDGADGILGLDFLRQNILTIDFVKKKISVVKGK